MTKVPIGQTELGPLKLDITRLVDTRLLICANSGGGKSWLLRLLVERAAKHVQVIILDPEGEFASLREKVDLALVGAGGELATDLRSAALLARKLVELSIPAIVDLYDLKLADRRQYVRLFLEALMSVPRQMWHPLLVIIDEAHMFAPERSAGEAESTNAVIALMSQGRKRGFAGVLTTQRISKLHKDAAAETNNVVIGRTWLDNDQARAADLLGFNKATRVVLRDLPAGEFYAFGPALSSDGVVRFTSDQVSTTHPKAGQRHKLVIPQASKAIAEVVQQVGDLPAQAVQETKDLSAATRRITELEREMRARPVQVKPERVVERVEVSVFKDGEVARLESAIAQLASVGAVIQSAAGEVASAIRSHSARPALPVVMPRPVTVVAMPRRPAPTVDSDTALRSGERKMLQALAQRHPARYTRAQLGTLSGFTPRGGTFQTYFGVLKRHGYITETNGEVEITSEGLAVVGVDVPPAPTTTAEMLVMWRSRLRAGEVKMLDTLVESYPDGMSRSVLGELSGFTSSGGTFQTYLGVLRRNGLADVRGDVVSASPTLFLDGQP